jgi:hypothetical protein
MEIEDIQARTEQNKLSQEHSEWDLQETESS